MKGSGTPEFIYICRTPRPAPEHPSVGPPLILLRRGGLNHKGHVRRPLRPQWQPSCGGQGEAGTRNRMSRRSRAARGKAGIDGGLRIAEPERPDVKASRRTHSGIECEESLVIVHVPLDRRSWTKCRQRCTLRRIRPNSWRYRVLPVIGFAQPIYRSCPQCHAAG